MTITILISGFSLGLTWFSAVNPKAGEAKMMMPAIIPVSFSASVGQKFGGSISSTLDCSLKTSCLQNPICTIVNCILQTPFILQFFENKSSQSGNAFDTMREKVLEPQEKTNCRKLCILDSGWYKAECAAWRGACPDLGVVDCYCDVILPRLQKLNTSPAGKQTAQLKAMAVSSGMKTPAIDFVLFPDPGRPPCNAMGNILGKGYGSSAVFFNIPGGMTPVGDNCRGSYYLSF